MPLRNDLLNPIPGENPSGENLRYAPVYDKIKEARREDDEGPQGIWAHERKVADWPSVVKFTGDTLATKSKDLQLAAWFTEAMLVREGASGLCESLDLIRGLLENFWDTLHPEIEDGDAEFRASPLTWVGDRLERRVKNIPLTKSKLDWFQYKESRALGLEESADTDEKQRSRKQAIAEGKVTQEQFDGDFAATSKKFYVDLMAAFDATLESISALSAVCDEKFTDGAPSFSPLQRVVEEVRQSAYILLQKKRETEPDEPVAAAEVEPEPEPEPEPETASQPAGQGAPARKKATGGLSAEPVDRDDAIARVVGAAKFLRESDASNPAAYLLLRGLRWGELRAAGQNIDQTLLSAPPTELRQNLKRFSLEGNWAGVLESGEMLMGMDCGRGWLDLQRYTVRACTELGWSYDAIRLAVISGVRGLLADYPQLPEMTLMDDTPTANAETMAWLKEQVLPPPPAPSEPEPEPAQAAPVWQTDEHAGPEAPPDAFELAMNAARRGRTQEGMEILMREMGQERSGRARFQRKSQLAHLCASTGNDGIALPILQDLAAEIERRRLEDWEASDMVAQPLALLYKCWGKDASPEERQKLYSWICRLDPLAAMTVTK